VTEDRTRTQDDPSNSGPAAGTRTVSAEGAGRVISFGPFRLFPTLRTLEKEGVAVALGNRALDILLVLAQRPGEVVSHRELIARVWRDLVVDPSNLRVHINSLRKVLGDGDGKERYIANVVGQGYSFVAPLKLETAAARPAQLPEYPCEAARQSLVLPPVLARMIGRDSSIRTIVADLIAERFVTIVGPGGIGKTTVAVSVAHTMLEEFNGAVCFVDLSTVTNPGLVAATIASKLGLAVQIEDVLPALMLCLRSLRILLVLDNCEHVVDAAATLAESIFQESSGVHILATSREALRVEGEHSYWLAPLETPPAESNLTAAEAVKFSAIKLFVERAAAGGSRLELTDADVGVVAGICGRLDGIPLAIEFAAARVGLHGLAGTSQLLKSRFGLQLPARRTAVPRHQTLHALLGWSHGLLSVPEQIVLRRLSIFVGLFTLEAAQAVACDSVLGEAAVVGALEGLVAKSLVYAAVASGVTRYRLLETTRVFAQERLEESSEKQSIARRHAEYFTSLLSAITRKIEARDSKDPLEIGEHLGNMRASLEWAFGSGGETADGRLLAVGLAASAAPILLELSLLAECHKWSAQGIARLDTETMGTRQEMVLQEAAAISATWAMANNESAREALTRAIDIAQRLGETPRRLRLLAGLHILMLRGGAVGASLPVAREFVVAADSSTDRSVNAVGDCLLGGSHHFLGHQPTAKKHLQRGLSLLGPLDLRLFGLDTRLRAQVTCSRVLWLSGFPDQAMTAVGEALRLAEAAKPVSVCFSYLYTAPLFLWCGNHRMARQVLDKLMAHPNWHALPSMHAQGLALLGALQILEGDIERGVELVRSAVVRLRVDGQGLLLAGAVCALARGLAAMGRFEEAAAALEVVLADVGEGTEMSHFPELLRIQGEVLFVRPKPDDAAAAATLERAIDAARQQGALSWELRASITLARLRLQQGRGREGREAVAAVYARFIEGFETPDLREAKQLLDVTGAPV
jgi:predicted ATPase/DNA-binding winged helix-turn-helix (wHTH) protein